VIAVSRGRVIKGKGVLRELLEIPGVGKSIARDLTDLGYKSIQELRSEDPQSMYERLCRLRNAKIDRCMLYVFRCAVYFATEPSPDPELLKWWNWKDG
jgi:hypothetical protein